MYPCSPESSFVPEKDGAMPTKVIGPLGFLDLKSPDEALFGTNISNDLHDQMLMSKNEAAAADGGGIGQRSKEANIPS